MADELVMDIDGKITQFGKSYYLRLPPNLINIFKLEKGDLIVLKVRQSRIFRKNAPTRLKLEGEDEKRSDEISLEGETHRGELKDSDLNI